MTFFDIAIIYFTFGAPVGMYSFLQQKTKELSPRAFLLPLFDMATWPRFVAGFFYVSVIAKKTRSISYTRKISNKTISDPQWSFFKQLDKTYGGVSKSSITLCLDRYLGLADAFANDLASASEVTIFSIAGHPNETVAVECLARRNRNRLGRHLNDARRSLVAVLSEYSPLLRAHDVALLIELISDIASDLGDRQLLAFVEDLRSKAPLSLNAAFDDATLEETPDQQAFERNAASTTS